VLRGSGEKVNNLEVNGEKVNSPFREWKKSKKKKGKVRRIIHSESYVHRYRRTEPN
jgi:hypothetical protein